MATAQKGEPPRAGFNETPGRLPPEGRPTADLAIDATGLGASAGHTGTGQIMQSLIAAMHDVRPDARVIVATENPEVLGADARSILTVSSLTACSGAKVLFRPRQILSDRDLRRVMLLGPPVVLFQLDTIVIDYEYVPSALAGRLLRAVVASALRSAAVVATLTTSSAHDIQRVFPGLDHSRIVQVPCGVDVPAHRGTQPVGLTQAPFVLVLSAAFIHKRRPFAVEVFAALRQTGYLGRLVLAGPEPVHGSTVSAEQALVVELGLGSEVDILGPVDDETKWWLLRMADAVLYPSEAEGFGLVPFEAAAVGTPCLVAAVSCFPEVLGPHVPLASSFDVDEWVDRLRLWINEPEEAETFVREVNHRAEVLTWRSAAEAAWVAVDRAAALGSPAIHGRFGLSRSERLWLQVDRTARHSARLPRALLGRRPRQRGY